MVGRCEKTQALSEADFCLAVYDVLLDIKIRHPQGPLPTKFQLAKRLNIGLRTVERVLDKFRRDGTLVVEKHAGQQLWGLQGKLLLAGGRGWRCQP